MNGRSMRSAKRYELRGKTTCQPTGPSSTRRWSRSKTPNKLKKLQELKELKKLLVQSYQFRMMLVSVSDPES